MTTTAWIDRTIIAERGKPLEPQGGLVALFGNLAPQGAILKRSAADASLFEHEGRAVVFSSLEDLAARVDDPEARCRCQGYPGAAECRPSLGVGHAGGGLSADPEETCHAGRQGHGARIGCAHERHGVRHHRIACDAGQRVRRPARRWCATATASGSRSSSGASISWWTMRELKRRAAAVEAVRAASRAGLCASLCAGNPRRRPGLRFRVSQAGLSAKLASDGTMRAKCSVVFTHA